jgi:hypothetical protein
MTTNAQAALIAAAATDKLGDEDNVKYLAEGYLKWLDSRDKPKPVQVPDADHPDLRKPQCGNISGGGLLCDRPAHGFATEHRNEAEGVSWGGSPTLIEKPHEVHVPPRHFLAAHGALHTACGESSTVSRGPGFAPERFTTLVRDVTCPKCKTELGLGL